MRTLRKVLCILLLAVLVTSSAAWAAPGDRTHEQHSVTTWVLSLINAVTSFLTPADTFDENYVGGEPSAAEAYSSDEFGGGVDPHGPPAPMQEGDSPVEEFGGGADPHG